MTKLAVFAVLTAAALPIAAHADVLVEQITWPSTPIPFAGQNSDPFPEFDPSLGTLTSYTLTVAGTGTEGYSGDGTAALNAQMAALTASLTQQYSALDSLLSSLQTTSSYLTQAFASLPTVQSSSSG